MELDVEAILKVRQIPKNKKTPRRGQDALVNPHIRWAPHPRIMDPTTVSAQGVRMGLQSSEDKKVWLPLGSYRFAK